MFVSIGVVIRFSDIHRRFIYKIKPYQFYIGRGFRGIRRLRVLYSCEEPVKRPAVEGAERRERTNLGTASFMPPIFGQMLAGKVLCEIAQVPEA